MRTPTKNSPRHLALAALVCTAAPAIVWAHGNAHHSRHLAPARPATLIGTCEAGSIEKASSFICLPGLP
jgi:hypothetical protein